MSRRARWKYTIDAIGQRLCDVLTRSSDAELRAFLRSIKRSPPTSSNCWWVSFRLAPLVAEIARNELLGRRQRERARKALDRAAVELHRDAGGVVRARRLARAHAQAERSPHGTMS